MFKTDEKKQIFVNWLWKVANADNDIKQDEIQLINNIAISLGIKEAKYKEISEVELDDFEKAFLLRELYRLAVTDKDFADCEKAVIQKFINQYKIAKNIVSATEKWANSYLENEKTYLKTIESLLSV